MAVIEQIKDKCIELEKENDFKILFAIESGSRLWRMDSSNSDYDIHLIFYYPLEKYLSLRRPKDVISWMSNDRLIDINGFDIYKFTKLLLKSNPNMLDWIRSDIVYFGDKSKIPVLYNFAVNNFNPLALYQAYYGIAHNTLKLIVKGRETTKKYLYVLRGILNAEWLLENNSLPSIIFEELVTKSKLPDELEKVIIKLLESKRKGSENMRISEEDVEVLEPFIQTKFDQRDDNISKLISRRVSKNMIKEFDNELKQIIEYNE